MKRTELVHYLDSYLRTDAISDVALNGLQVEGSDEVTRIAAAVDASLSTFEKAAELGAQMLIAHHGLYFGSIVPVTGIHYKRMKTLIEHGISLYASHLPLDMHPECGNNAELARIFGLTDITPFGEYHGVTIGFGGTLSVPSTPHALADILSRAAGAECAVKENRPQSRKIAVVSGGGSFALDEAARCGYDTLVTGEPDHITFHPAREYGVNLIFGGHYSTETLGVKALCAHLAEKFGLEWNFIDMPTGM
ncbi:MAG TPA: Nif3-like dinuclear metal center hexameric protein [Spirochaetota bacterium]|nr:Nif3-like dinuclear metal center hexameric protein [Spirochaetota bacterium]